MPAIKKFHLFAANGSAIATYKEELLCLKLGLRQPYKWRFVIANVGKPFLGADYLKLIPRPSSGYEDKFLIDTATHMSTLATLASARSISTIAHRTTQISSLFSQFPEICRMSPVPTTKMHAVAHHITTKGIHIKQRVRRLAPNKLKIAQAEYQYMVEQGVCLLLMTSS